MIEALHETLTLFASLQRERGLALRAAPVGSFEASAAFEMQSTFTSLAMEELQKKMPDLSFLMPRRFFDAMALRNNESFRGSQPIEALAEWYAFNIEQPIQQLALSQLTENPRFSPAQTSALVHEVASLVYLCQLRDIGLAIYAKAEISSSDISKMKAAAASCLARERIFLGIADENLKHLMDEARGANLRVLGETDEILTKIKAGQGKSLLAETPLHVWYEKIDGELTARHDALRQVIAQLNIEGKELAQLNAPGQALDGDVEHAFDAISSLPLFRGLSDASLRSLLKGAKIADLDKNVPFLTQGEPTSRFYILMDGWARLYKTTDEGEEAILQILSKKECVLDNVFLSTGVSAISAKTVTKSRLLSLSLPVLRDNVTRSRELAQNLLAATTNRLQKLVAHFEQITLRTAVQRVGWFLVNLHLETGLEGAPLVLPYDKALIASYLNIKPETFSRVLQQFRKEGFIIDKHQVIMPHPQALCSYCDPEMATRCCRAEAVNCAPIRAAKRAEGR